MILDTHVFLWFLENDPKLSSNIKNRIEAEPNIYISIVSIWEIAIKLNINKLRLNYSFSDLEKILRELNLQILDITLTDLEHYRNLPLHHRDPFDRLIIAQAKHYSFPLISKDENFKKYDVNLICE